MLAGIPPSRRKVAMPVYVESVTQPSPQDLTDLAKIYADAPDWLLAPYSSADTLIAAALADTEFAIRAEEATNTLFARWRFLHILLGCLIFALLALHVGAAIYYGLRWL